MSAPNQTWSVNADGAIELRHGEVVLHTLKVSPEDMWTVCCKLFVVAEQIQVNRVNITGVSRMEGGAA